MLTHIEICFSQYIKRIGGDDDEVVVVKVVYCNNTQSIRQML